MLIFLISFQTDQFSLAAAVEPSSTLRNRWFRAKESQTACCLIFIYIQPKMWSLFNFEMLKLVDLCIGYKRSKQGAHSSKLRGQTHAWKSSRGEEREGNRRDGERHDGRREGGTESGGKRGQGGQIPGLCAPDEFESKWQCVSLRNVCVNPAHRKTDRGTRASKELIYTLPRNS